MGSCVSIHHHQEEEPATNLQIIESKTQNFVMTDSPDPLKQHKTTIFNRSSNHHLLIKSSPSPTTFPHSAGSSKEDTFFDSQAWLDSDCDDDFLSTYGDFTPSRNNTPVHNTFPTRMGTPPVNRGEQTTAFKPEPSPARNKRKKLSDLFRESLRGSRNDDGQNKMMIGQRVNPFLSRANTLQPKHGKEKSVKSVQCCFPRSLTTRSYGESKTRIILASPMSKDQ